ncbi:MAG TPA: hypothetical protein VGJ94_01715 [Syntrophorhabdaceae bacterium]|jgi:hypothetical protein
MKKYVLICVALLFALSVVSGCSSFGTWSNGKEEKSKTDLPNQAFYGFPDIPVPTELTYSQNKSFIYETQTMKVGVLVLTGNVDLPSLEDYFKVNMVKNGWRFVNSFKFKGDIASNYVKDDKTANIKMSRESFSSEVQIWVGPATSLDKGSPQRGNGPAR